MSKSIERYQVLQVQFVPDKTDEQPTKLIKMKDGVSVETLLATLKPGSVYAWRTFMKEVYHGGLLEMLLASSEDAHDHTPWKFLLGEVFTLEEMHSKRHERQAALDYQRERGRNRAVLVKGDLVVYIKDEDDVSQITK